MEKKLYTLKINPELEKIVPPLTPSEYELLKEDILTHGCLQPLTVWGDVIVDGHQRYKICKANNIPFAINKMDFADTFEAKLWIIKNQLCRRNYVAGEKKSLTIDEIVDKVYDLIDMIEDGEDKTIILNTLSDISEDMERI